MIPTRIHKANSSRFTRSLIAHWKFGSDKSILRHICLGRYTHTGMTNSPKPTVGRYPGLGLNLRYFGEYEGEEDIYPLGIHASCLGAYSEMLLVREVAMMTVMDRLTDKPNWHVKVFDDRITEKWIQEALALPVGQMYYDVVNRGTASQAELESFGPGRLETVLDRGCLEYCIKELRAKAEFFEKTGLIPTIDASATAVKSDNIINGALHDELRTAFVKLKEEQGDNPDWHPQTDGKVQDLVHPSLYPLVYGRSRGFRDEVVGVEDAIDRWAGEGDVIFGHNPEAPVHWRGRYGSIDDSVPESFWSDKYQWLPSNVKFQGDGCVRFTSYINGLHPNKHHDIYRTIEKLIEKALPAWDFCLARYENPRAAGRTMPRFPLPDNPDDGVEENWNPPMSSVISPLHSDIGEAGVGESASSHESHEERLLRYYKEMAWSELRQPVQPEPPEFQAWNYGVKSGESLRERFKELQIIVKMTSIELTPEKPSFPAGGWHVEGQMNEHIIGTALYYLDSENVTPSHLHFRMQTCTWKADDDFMAKVEQDSFNWLERVYGTNLRDMNAECLQGYGSVETRQGRLLAFPNVFHHRVSSFELQNKTKRGHRRFIALWLVDPHTRIINTGNVPPQQQSWWAENKFGGHNKENANNEPQAMGRVSDATPEHSSLKASVECGEPLPVGLISLKEAKDHRLKLMEERTRFQDQAVDEWTNEVYSFCEH